MCGTGEKWSVEALTDTIKFDHGYTATSTAISFFLDILTELDAADQRRFLRFVTGSPRLPPGGIAALHPRCAPPNCVLHPSAKAAVQHTMLFLLEACSGTDVATGVLTVLHVVYWQVVCCIVVYRRVMYHLGNFVSFEGLYLLVL